MLYALHEMAYQSAAPLRLGAQMARQFWTSPFNPASQTAIGRTAYASAELFESLTRRYGKPDWRLETITVGGKPVRTVQEVVWSSPWSCSPCSTSCAAEPARAAALSPLSPHPAPWHTDRPATA